jgi:2-amino-4-hydroxy-6-hydroxymethyldihydropteridine diphosphokinase
MEIYCSLGSNIGERKLNLEQALQELKDKSIKVLQKSAVYVTQAWGDQAQEDYLNMAIQVETDLSPLDLLHILKTVERKIGRTDDQGHMQPRVLDIDILFYGDSKLNTEELQIPHPRLKERIFALLPLLEIAEDFIDPISQKPVWQLYDECPDTSEIAIYEETV